MLRGHIPVQKIGAALKRSRAERASRRKDRPEKERIAWAWAPEPLPEVAYVSFFLWR